MDYYFYDYDHVLPDDDDRIVYKFTEKDIDEVWINCVQPSFKQISQYVVIIICWNFTFRFLWALCMIKRVKSLIVGHILSVACGFSVLYITVGDSCYYLLCFALIGYFLQIILLAVVKTRQIGPTFLCLSLTILSACELLYNEPKVWHRIRGIQMISTMKAISLAFDLDKNKVNKFPNIIQYLGYIFCPANCAHGPWVPFDEYLAAFTGPTFRIIWIGWACFNGIVSIIFLILSNCLVSMICSDLSWKWLVAYRDALTFRCSHYFISFFSQATMCAGGFAKDKEDCQIFGVIVTKPWEIELPRSLVTVVTNWNIPMHRWLKAYVFKPIKLRGIRLAIFTTYLVSSLLHGLNAQIYLVLLSLGVYTYLEYRWRQKISLAFNACILSTPCKQNCSHNSNSFGVITLIFNPAFSVLAIINLAYLGVMFEASSNLQEEGYSFWHAWHKWDNLNFAGHWIAVAGYIFYLLL